LADLKAQRAGNDEKLAAGVGRDLQFIESYRAAHSEQEMQQPAILPEDLKMAFFGELGRESDGGNMLITIDPSYFRSDLLREAAQLVLLVWRREKDSKASESWQTTFERDFPIERLRELLGR